jgi:hypothetical protein
MPESVTAELISAARVVIAHLECTLLLIERTVRSGQASIRIDAIHADGSRDKGVTGSDDPAMRKLCYAANATLQRVATMLPVGSGDAIGLMTDGTGAAFSPDHVSSISGDWLGAVLTGAALCVDLARFNVASRWAQLVAPNNGGRAH